MSTNFLDDLAKEAETINMDAVPTEEGSARLRKAAMELVAANNEVARLEAELKTTKELFNTLSNRTIPDIMLEIGQDVIGLPDVGETGVDIISTQYVHANIRSDWDEERRAAAFSLLDRKGAGDMIRNILTMQFSKGENEKVKAFLLAIEDERFGDLMREYAENNINHFELPPVHVEMGVPWNTLTSYVKKEHSQGTLRELWMDEVDPVIDPVEVLGATIGTVAKIKVRKAK